MALSPVTVIRRPDQSPGLSGEPAVSESLPMFGAGVVPPKPANLAKTLLKGVQVMEAFDAHHRELSLTDVVQATGLEISGARRLLTTLVVAGYLDQDRRTRRYRLSAKVLNWSVAYLGTDPLVACAYPILQNISHQSGHQFELSVLEGGDCIVVVSVASAREKISFVKGPSIGVREPAFCASTGLAILAQLPSQAAYDLLASWPREKVTEDTITDIDAIMTSLANAREKGFSSTFGSCHPRAISIGAPVMDFGGQPAAAVAVTVDVDDFTVAVAERDLSPMVMKTAQAISLAYRRAI
jgi:DNA-binding IclR family transcriptional regulator